MKITIKQISLVAATTLLLSVASCSKSAGDKLTAHDSSQKVQGLRVGMVYQSSRPSLMQVGGSFLSSSTGYVFSKDGVSVYWIISENGDVLRRQTDGSFLTGNDAGVRAYGGTAVGGFQKGAILGKGDIAATRVEVIFGPGDKMPILENAPYKVEGSSVYVDWSQSHSQYFGLSGCNSGSEVFTIKNDGLVLDSATAPGYTLTLSISTGGPGGIH